MQTCPHCSHQNEDVAAACIKCGKPLGNMSREPVPTTPFKDTLMVRPKGFPTSIPKVDDGGQAEAGTIRLDLVAAEGTLVIPLQKSLLMGRPDPMTGRRPDIDLTELAGYRMGVSRRHAEIHWYGDDTINVYDLGSHNGTYLNGERLKAREDCPLHNGDELRLGHLSFNVFYNISTEDKDPVKP